MLSYVPQYSVNVYPKQTTKCLQDEQADWITHLEGGCAKALIAALNADSERSAALASPTHISVMAAQ